MVPYVLCTRGQCCLSGQVLLSSGPLPKVMCTEHFSGGVMHQATPPAKRLPLARLDIPGAPCGIHVPGSTAQMVSIRYPPRPFGKARATRCCSRPLLSISL